MAISTFPGPAKDYTNPGGVAALAGQGAAALGQTGASLVNTGTDALIPVFKRLMSLVSGNPADVTAATAPETASIIKQYDTALDAAVRNTPRGGGLAASTMGLKSAEASDISTTRSKAVSDASQQLGQLASATTGQGVSAESSATAELGNLVTSALQGKHLSNDMWQSLGLGLGKIFMGLFTGFS